MRLKLEFAIQIFTFQNKHFFLVQLFLSLDSFFFVPPVSPELLSSLDMVFPLPLSQDEPTFMEFDVKPVLERTLPFCIDDSNTTLAASLFVGVEKDILKR